MFAINNQLCQRVKKKFNPWLCTDTHACDRNIHHSRLTRGFKQIQEEYNRSYKMELFVLYKCFRLPLLIATVIRMQFANAILTDETAVVPHTLDVVRGSLHAGIGPASTLSRNAGSDMNLAPMAEHQINSAPSRRRLESCGLKETCHTKQLNECDFTGCQKESVLNLRNRGLWGTLPENLNTLLPDVHIL